MQAQSAFGIERGKTVYRWAASFHAKTGFRPQKQVSVRSAGNLGRESTSQFVRGRASLVGKVTIEGDFLDVKVSLLDQLLSFHGSFHIPLAHVTNAYVSDLEDLQLQYRLAGTNLGFLKMAGVYANPSGIIFCDIDGDGDCLVIETRGERFPRIAVQLPAGEDPNQLAHEIAQSIPDSGPVD